MFSLQDTYNPFVDVALKKLEQVEGYDRSEKTCQDDSLGSEKQANAPEGQEGGENERVTKEDQSEGPVTDKVEGNVTAEGSTHDADSMPQGNEGNAEKSANAEGETKAT